MQIIHTLTCELLIENFEKDNHMREIFERAF